MRPRLLRQTGLTLIELMVALAVSLLAVLAAVRLHADAGAALRAAEVQQSLTETATLALAAIRTDAERAGYFAFAGADALAVASGGAAPAVRGDCGTPWATRLDEPIGGNDGGYRWACPAWSNAAMTGSDTLVLRYADPRPAETLERGRLYLESAAAGTARIFASNGGEPVATAPLAATNALHARGYYVSTSSTGSAGPAPALRVKYLARSDSGPRIVDEEVQPGVEDLQVEFGIAADDTADGGPGRLERFVPAAAIEPGNRIVAIRIWLLVRSADRDGGFPVESIPAYAGRPSATHRDGHRRRLVSTTIAIDDARPL